MNAVKIYQGEFLKLNLDDVDNLNKIVTPSQIKALNILTSALEASLRATSSHSLVTAASSLQQRSCVCVLFFEAGLENVKFWHILAIFCRKLTHLLAYFLQVVYQNWEISRMELADFPAVFF